MNNEDIVRMAREVGIEWDLLDEEEGQIWYITKADLERFAALVAAAEREKVARWQIGSGYSTGHGDTIEDLLVELEWQVRESEREACAKECDVQASWGNDDERFGARQCGYAIRARSNT